MRIQKLILAPLCLGALFFTTHTQTAHAACGRDIYTGTVCFMASNFCPSGYVKADGVINAISSDQALYSLLTDKFGGNNTSTFALPDLRGRSAISSGNSIEGGLVLRGQQRGTQSMAIVESQMPHHAHLYEVSDIFLSGKLKGSTSTNRSGSPAGKYLSISATAASPQFAPSGTTTPMADNTISGTFNASAIKSTTSTGGGQPFNNEGPRLGLTACIAIGGNLYPPRD